MKKITLAMIASASLLLSAPAMDGNTSGQGNGMMMQGGGCKMMKMQSNSHCKGAMPGMAMAGKNMMTNKKMDVSPFLIERGLPHLSKMLKGSWEDPALALTAEQRSSLTTIREETLGNVMRLTKEILPLKSMIVSAALSGKSAADLKENVEKLGQLEAEATLVQIKCLEETKNILSKDQLIYLFQKNMIKNN